MQRNVLVGLPAGANSGLEERFTGLIKNAIPNISLVECVRNLDEFSRRLHSGSYSICLCVDDLGRDNEYSAVVRGAGFDSILCILVVPNDKKGSALFRDLIGAGCTRIVFQKDFGARAISDLILYGRSKAEAEEYCGISLLPTRTGQVVNQNQEQREAAANNSGGTQVSKRVLSNGTVVTRMCGADAKRLGKSGVMDDDDLITSMMDDVSTDLDEGVMPEKIFEIDEPWIGAVKDRLNAYFRKEGIHVFNEFLGAEDEYIKKPTEANKRKYSQTLESFEEAVYARLRKDNCTGEAADKVRESFVRDIRAYGKLDVLIRYPDITDVRLMSWDMVNVQYRGVWYRTNIKFDNPTVYTNFINRLCSINGKSVNMSSPDSIFTDISTYPDRTLRVTVSHGRLLTNQSYTAHIRVSSMQKKTVRTLLDEGFMTETQAKFLISAMRKGKSIVICGGSGSGKTILMNMLLEYLDVSICGACVQESDELHSNTHPNIKFMHSIDDSGVTQYTLEDAARQAVMENVSCLIIGEIKGPEAGAFLRASRTASVYSTTHSEDVFGALNRLTELSKAVADYTQEEILKIYSKNIDYVVYCEKYRCKQVASVVGYDDVRKDVIYDYIEFPN